ncbi:MAG: response regulator [Chlorobi bacterium]|nr:response regulator [Chlorobiota bacterium]
MKQRHKVLYVDDESSNLRIFKDTFRRDFEVFTAIPGFDAFDILGQLAVDVVITDQRIPGMTGVDLLCEISKRFSEIPPNRLILSGYMEDEHIKEAFEKYKLSRFVPKPWNYVELLEIINKTIKT